MTKQFKLACAVSTLSLASAAQAQLSTPEIDAHIAKAKDAAFEDFMPLFARNCAAPRARHAGNDATDPGRDHWYVEPQKVFDNLYFLGTRFHTAWAVDTGEGIVIIDTLYNYAVDPSIVQGLEKFGLDPKDIKYVFITHAHSDHDQGARLLQERYGARVVMGAGDWDEVAKRESMPGGKPVRDLDAVDGGTITVGNTRFTQILTPPHSPGAYGMLFDVLDNGRPVPVAYASGTAMRWTPEFYPQFISSLEKLSAAAKQTDAAVLLSNHTWFDNAWTLAKLAAWRPEGTPNPFVIGQDRVQNYFTVMIECARAGQAWLNSPLARQE